MSEVYENPLVSRYSSSEMSFVFSPSFTFSTWRQLWISLAKGQLSMGMKGIKEEHIQEMELFQHITSEEVKRAEVHERETRHDVMAHIFAYGESCPKAKSIIHTGATSCYVKDNTYLCQMKNGLTILQQKMLSVLYVMKDFCLKTKDIPCLGFTHFQAAQLTTVGKRGTLWLQDFIYDFKELSQKLELVMTSFRGVRGTTGTQASFLKLFEGDHQKVRKLNEYVTKEMGFKKHLGVCGQTYTRKIDFMVLSALSQIAQSCHKLAVDIRLLSHLKEIEEPHGKSQVGSSAMAYKRNPMRCERICSIARFVISLLSNTAHTHANQWFERSLDDSANRRLVIAQAFLATDGLLKLVNNVMDGIVVWEKVIEKNVIKELPFMITENIIMETVKQGGDRQAAHEKIRTLSFEATKKIKMEGSGENELIEKMKREFMFSKINLDELTNPKNFIGRAPEQVTDFIKEYVDPIINQFEVTEKSVEELYV